MRRSKAPSQCSKIPKIDVNDSVGSSMLSSKTEAIPNMCTPSVETIIQSETGKLYFSVVYGKLSKKKHKSYDGDGIIVVNGRSVTLMDTEGKEVSRSSGFKLSDLESLDSGNTLIVGSKEIEIQNSIPEQSFLSGRCFSSSVDFNNLENKEPVSYNLAPKIVRTGFRPVIKSDKTIESNLVSSVFDPNLPDALVLPRPSPKQIFTDNPKNCPIAEVVVDPYIASKLRPHQREGIVFLYRCVMGMNKYPGQGAILADEMGLGKTIQCIALIYTLLKQGPYGGSPVIKKCLIVTPGSLVKNWSCEFQKWLGRERLAVIFIDSGQCLENYVRVQREGVVVISYEMFLRHTDLLTSTVQFDIVICDEGHRLKNSGIKTTVALDQLSTRRRIILSGTPIQNDLEEFFALVDFCNPGLLGSAQSFRRLYSDAIVSCRSSGATETQIQLGRERAAELARQTELFILRRTQSVNTQYLPPKIETVVFCRPSELQISLFQSILESQAVNRTLNNILNSGPTSCGFDGEVLSLIMTLKKLCNDPALLYNSLVTGTSGNDKENCSLKDRDMSDLLSQFPDNYVPAVEQDIHSGKLWVAGQMLATLSEKYHSQKIVLVSHYTKTLDILGKLCGMLSLSCLRIDGKTPTNKRVEIVEKFNSRHHTERVLLLSSKAGGVGLNLIGAAHLILYDIDWNPANDMQAMARVWRDGQKSTVRVYRLLTTGTLEEKIFQRQIVKQGLSGQIVDSESVSSSGVTFDSQELKELFYFDENTLCLTHDLLKCNCHQEKLAKLDASQEINNAEEKRSCQLGIKNETIGCLNSKKLGATMAQLMSWTHLIGADEIAEFNDELLVNAAENITALFTHEVNVDKCGPNLLLDL